MIDGHEIVLRASIGVVLAEREHVTAEELLQQSDDAMYRAKARGGGRPQLYTPGRARERAGHEIQVESALRRAIPDELVAHYQPVVELDGGRLVGVEALVRWQHPSRGLVPPGEFIPVAEQSGLVVALGDWMLGESCRQAVGWDDLRVSVNVSGRQIAEGSLVASVARALEESGLAPYRLQLELTETVLMDDIDGHVALMREVKELGVSLALDDFGKGYSSLSYLHRFPIDRIKIDRAFVGGLPESRAALAIVSAVVSFAGALDIEVVAEGVETQAHVDALREPGLRLRPGVLLPPPGRARADHRPTRSLSSLLRLRLRGGPSSAPPASSSWRPRCRSSAGASWRPRAARRASRRALEDPRGRAPRRSRRAGRS